METTNDSRLASSYWALRVTFILVPLLAGLDKFTNLMTYWPNYLSPSFSRFIPIAPEAFMRIVGVIEVIASLLVLSRLTRIGAYVVMGWLVCIAINLMNMRMFDLAVRDLAMAVGAFALARLQELRTPATERPVVFKLRSATV